MAERSIWRRAAGSAVVVGILAVGISLAGKVGAQTGRASVPRCAPASLVVWTGRTTAAAGSRTSEFGFTNDSASSCFLHGHPRVQMLNRSGMNLSTSEEKAAGAFGIEDRTVILTAGKTAYFGVEYASQTGYANLTCPMSASLKLTPPQNSGSLMLRASGAQIAPYGGSIEHLECGIIRVTAVTADRFQ